ncbi:uncharacterized protein G2W53_028137 [Senna tora]|uniref:Uncharacterized protein n=1 Tax=Senna tora TaxID=362788 RepID=A0A834T2U0_9FABA|nr:uncharacterized protein G2W53_028137 [Senna tora]
MRTQKASTSGRHQVGLMGKRGPSDDDDGEESGTSTCRDIMGMKRCVELASPTTSRHVAQPHHCHNHYSFLQNCFTAK